MQRWKAILAYDGTPYQGWQIQPGCPTVQGALASALHHITGETTLPQGSGRTDTGVHALAQAAHFDLSCPIPPENLHRALNRSLPPSIRILTVTRCSADFHARHSARRKTYEYRILPRPQDRESICPPFLARYVWPCPYPLDVSRLNQAAAQIVGTHDFTSFAAVNPDQFTRKQELCDGRLAEAGRSHRPASGYLLNHAQDTAATPNTRTIHCSTWTYDQSADPPILRYRVTGSGFLHHMVRNLVGTFADCAAGRLDPAEILGILAARNRQAAGPTAPAQGLFLVEVAY